MPIGPHSVIRHAYENVLTASARLFAFATGRLPAFNGPIDEHQVRLATDDLVTFAIHCGRLTDSTFLTETVSRVTIKDAFRGTQGAVPITKINDVLIRHKKILVVRTQERLRIEIGTWAWRDLSSKHTPLKPVCMAISQEDTKVSFEVEDLIRTFETGVLKPVIDRCDEHHLWLETLK